MQSKIKKKKTSNPPHQRFLLIVTDWCLLKIKIRTEENAIRFIRFSQRETEENFNNSVFVFFWVFRTTSKCRIQSAFLSLNRKSLKAILSENPFKMNTGKSLHCQDDDLFTGQVFVVIQPPLLFYDIKKNIWKIPLFFQFKSRKFERIPFPHHIVLFYSTYANEPVNEVQCRHQNEHCFQFFPKWLVETIVH